MQNIPFEVKRPIQNEEDAAEYLMRAWMMEGEEIFKPDENGEDDGSKYYEFLGTHVALEKGK